MKQLSILVPVLLISVFFASSALAAGLSFTPSSGTYNKGQTYSVSIYVNPASDSIYTVKAEVKYPADLLEVKSFSLASGWMALSQPGYDEINNNSGILIKTGGYAGGLENNALFGTITFYAKDSGSASVSIGNGSQVLDDNSKNVLTSRPSASFTLSEIESVAPAPATQDQSQTAPIPEVTTIEEKSTVDNLSVDVGGDNSVAFVEPAPINLTAMALGLAWAGYLNSPSLILLTILAVLVLAAVVKKEQFFAAIKKLKKSFKKNK